MLHALTECFDHLVAPRSGSSETPPAQAVQLATAVLMVEVMRADSGKTPAERQAVLTLLQQRFSLEGPALAELLVQAEQSAEQAYDYHRFTASINAHCSQPQKLQIIESMWQVAYADAQLGAQQRQVISQVADLLYVTHGEYIGAKMRAKEAAGLL